MVNNNNLLPSTINEKKKQKLRSYFLSLMKSVKK